MPEIPDHISLNDLLELSNSAERGPEILDINEYKIALNEFQAKISELHKQLANTSCNELDQERSLKIKQANKALLTAVKLIGQVSNV